PTNSDSGRCNRVHPSRAMPTRRRVGSHANRGRGGRSGRRNRRRLCCRSLPRVVPMKPLRPQLRGLIVKLALFYVLLSVPSLVLVESGILIFEFQELMAGVERGSLQRVSAHAATDLGEWWAHAADEEHAALSP